VEAGKAGGRLGLWLKAELFYSCSRNCQRSGEKPHSVTAAPEALSLIF
jgi:hypothetical protein